jgi:hypothetical protein
MLSQIDLAAPNRSTRRVIFAQGFFFLRILPPERLIVVPAEIFPYCQHLAERNIGDCIALRKKRQPGIPELSGRM